MKNLSLKLMITMVACGLYSSLSLGEEICFKNPFELNKIKSTLPSVFQEIPLLLGTEVNLLGKNLGAGAIEIRADKNKEGSDTIYYNFLLKKGSTITRAQGEIIRICLDKENDTFKISLRNGVPITGSFQNASVVIENTTINKMSQTEFKKLKNKYFSDSDSSKSDGPSQSAPSQSSSSSGGTNK